MQLLFATWKEDFELSAGYFPEITSESLDHRSRRRAQRQAARQLIAGTTGTINITYDETGKPVVDNGTFVSISHSGPLVVVASGSDPVGVDAEKISPKARYVANRFLGTGEEFFKRSDRYATLAWSVKEAVYKMQGMRGLTIIRDILITGYNPQAGEIEIFFTPKAKTLRVNYAWLNGFLISWAQEAK